MGGTVGTVSAPFSLVSKPLPNVTLDEMRKHQTILRIVAASYGFFGYGSKEQCLVGVGAQKTPIVNPNTSLFLAVGDDALFGAFMGIQATGQQVWIQRGYMVS